MPANGFTWGTTQTINPISGTTGVNTSTCVTATVSGGFVAGILQGGACVFTLDALVVAKGGTLVASGDRPLVLLVRGDVLVAGTIDAGGKEQTPGPGGGAASAWQVSGPPGEGHVGDCGSHLGGGGGGYGTAGGPSCGGVGGAVTGTAELVPLAGGNAGGVGGGGGGVLQISATGTLRVDGAITVGGGGGSSGGGGGSGGGVLLEAARIEGAGIVAANGGGGGAYTWPSTDATGADGDASWQPAAGATAGPGTIGGSGATAAFTATAGAGDASGGGGGVGRVRYNTPAPPPTPPLPTSAHFSVGRVQLN